MHPKTFIHQLHAILQDSQLQEWISWSKDDDSVFVLKPHNGGFSKYVLRRYFKHGNVSSFVRQLHMYGFHKITNPQEDADEGGSDEQGDRPTNRWFFAHPLGYFKKDADLATLKKIQRKSTGVGKDGRRKNVLSTVCVNYVGSTGSEEPAVPLADRSHYASLPLLPATGPLLAKQEPHYQQPLLPHIHRQEHLISKSRTISSPELIQRPGSMQLPSEVATPIPMLHFHRSSSPFNTQQPNFPLPGQRTVLANSYITPASSAFSSTSSVTSYSMIEYHHRLDNNLQLLRNSLVKVADIIPSLFDSGPENKTNIEDHIITLGRLKDELVAENNSSRIQSLQSSFAGPSTSGTFPSHINSNAAPDPKIITPISEAAMNFKPRLPDDGDKHEEPNFVSKDFTAL